MRTETLNWLACPAPGCAGPLSTGTAFAPVHAGPEEELLEAVLACVMCGAEYPVILGVALLENDLGSYLGAFWSEIEACGGELPEVGISRAMRSYLGIPSAFSGQAGPAKSPDANLQWSTSPYLQAHFDKQSLPDDFASGWWRDTVESHLNAGSDPYSYLLGAARELGAGSVSDGLAIDVGTSVGHGAAELAGLYPYAVGVDRSFRAILAARRHLLGSPAPLNEYLLETEKGRWEPKRLPDPGMAGNLDYVVASGSALPAAAESSCCLAALNVLCAVPEPLAMVHDFARVLRPGGTLLLSSPFWADPSGDGETPLARGGPQYLRSVLEPAFVVTREQDGVPWLLRVAKRRWELYLCHCVVAARR